MLERARLRFQGRDGIELRLGEIEHLPLRDEEVALAVMNMVLHHLPQPQEGLREACRALEPGGTFVLADLAKHERELLRSHHGDRWLGFAPDQLERWMVPVGFEMVDRETHAIEHDLAINIVVARKIFRGGE